jgi:signal transduction histidine kinase
VRPVWTRARLLQEAIFDRPAGQVVAAARLALACFALLAIWLDPTQPDRYPAFTYSVLAAYVVHAAIMAILVRRPFSQGLHVVAHVIDVLIIALLIYLTEGPTSPFFVLASFALLSATLHWQAPGVLLTAAALIVLQLLVNVIDGVPEIDRFIMRSGYLIVGAALFAYYGIYRERVRSRLARLAEWPPDEVSLDELPAFDRLLAHAAAVMQSRRVVVAWECEQSPRLFVSVWTGGAESVTDSHAPDVFGDVVAAAVADLPLTVERALPRLATTPRGAVGLGQPVVNEAFAVRYGITGRLASAPFESADARGRVFFVEPKRFGDDLLSLVQIVSAQIGSRIQHHQVRHRLQQALIARERASLADDLHDTTLQVMTAAALQLKQMADRETSEETRARLVETRTQLRDQQERLRSFVTLLREVPGADAVPLDGALRDVLSTIEDVWKCATVLEVVPASAILPQRLRRHVDFILMEAAANACRHGQATAIRVSAHAQADQLSLTIGNNGRALPQTAEGPVSIRRRVQAMGGRLSLANGDGGVALHMTIPLAGGGQVRARGAAPADQPIGRSKES